MIRSSAAPIAARTLIAIDGNRREPTSTGANKRPTTEATPPRAASSSRSRAPVLSEADDVTADGPARIEGAHRQLEDPLRTAHERHDADPRSNSAMRGHDSARPVAVSATKEHRVDREAHEEHVDPVAGQPERAPRSEGAAAHQAHEPRPERPGVLDLVREDRAAC